MVEPAVENWMGAHILPFYVTSRFLTLRLLEDDASFLRSFTASCGYDPAQDPAVVKSLQTAYSLKSLKEALSRIERFVKRHAENVPRVVK